MDEDTFFIVKVLFIALGIIGTCYIVAAIIIVPWQYLPVVQLLDQPLRVCVIENGKCTTDITAEYANASIDSERECNQFDRYSQRTRYVCVCNLSQGISSAERDRGATSKAYEYFIYSFIYDNRSIRLEPNRLYFIKYDLQIGYCRGAGKITYAEKVMDYCDECTRDPDGRLQGCCKEVGCASTDGSGRVF